VNRLGYRVVTVAGMALIALGYAFFLSRWSQLGMAAVVASAILIGVGMGFSNLTTLVAAQTAVQFDRIGVATSTVMLFRTFGGAFIVSLMGTVMFNRMQAGLERFSSTTGAALSAGMRDKMMDPQNLLEPATRALIPPDQLSILEALLSDAMWYAFLTTFVLMLIGVILSLVIAPYTTPAGAARAKVAATIEA
jgi:hypothetical protein